MLTYTDIPDTDVDADSPITVNLMTLMRDNPIAALEDFIGCMFFHGATTPPASTLECDGSAVSRTTYADLFAVIGTSYGVGDGSTTFNLPDLRAEFIRGWDNGRGIDTAGSTFGRSQAFQQTQHSHGVGSYTYDYDPGGGGATDRPQGGNSGSFLNNPIAGSSASVGGSTNSSETRPRNVSGMFVIIYKGKPT